MVRLLSILFFSLLMIACGPSGTSSSNATPSATPVAEPAIKVEPEEGRYAWQKPQVVIGKMGDLSDKVVADIGAGTGYFTFRIAPRAERVIAVDIDQDMLQLVEVFRQNLDSLQQTKIETRLATESSPELRPEEVDMAIMINTIGYIDDKLEYLENLRASLREDGELLLVDFKMKRIPDNIAPGPKYRVSLLSLEDLLTRAGYQDIIVDDRSLEYQWMVKAHK